MGRLRTEAASSQMPYPVSIGFQFRFRKPGYRFVKFTEYCGFVARQCTCNWHRIGNMVTEQIDFDVQPINECPHLHQTLYLRLLDICAVQHVLIQLRLRKYGQRNNVYDARMQPVQNIGSGYRTHLTVTFASETV